MKIRDMFDRPVRAFRGWSMKRKMLVLFSVPVIIAILCIYMPGNFYLQRTAGRQQKKNTEQALSQAGSFISYQLQNLRILTEQLNNSEDLSRLLSNPEFGRKSRLQDGWLEYWNINQIIQQFEVTNAGEYRIGLYVPDEAFFSNNNFNFYSVSELEERDDYEEIREQLEGGQNVYRIFRDKRTTDPSSAQDYLALLHMLRVTCTDGAERDYIIKVEVRTGLLQSTLANARPTENSAVFLTDEDGKRICSSRGEGQGGAVPEDAVLSVRTPDWTALNTGNGRCFAVEKDVEGSTWRVVAYIPEREYYWQFSGIIAVMILMLLAVALMVFFISYLLSGYYSRRISTLNEKMTDIGKDGPNVKSEVPAPESSRDELDTLYANFDFMIAEIRKLLKEEYRLGRDVSKMEVKALSAQINPHFLYNTLDLINWGALDYGAEDVAALARSLGQFYRLSLNHGSSAILIRDEIRHVQAFVSIENEHYDHVISLSVSVPEELQTCACLNITLQPFVENCIVHGIGEHSEIKECHIDISAEKEGGDIIFTVKDDGPGMDEALARQLSTQLPDGKGKGYGVANVNFRIKLVYGEQYGVTYSSGNMDNKHGTTVKIRIKALSMEELVQII